MTLAERLAAGDVLHMAASVAHARRGPIRHAFRYGADYLLFSPEHLRPRPFLSRNRFNLMSFYDTDHGGPRGAGTGSPWAWARFAEAGLEHRPGLVLGLLAQPRFLGHWFNPVSFWMVIEGDTLVAAIAEVSNTFGQRHSYLCRAPGFAPITPDRTLDAAKVFHVSPFLDVSGGYHFNFAVGPGRLAIRIRHTDGDKGLDAAMAGALEPLTARGALRVLLRRPGGSLRVLALIYWHALRLRLKRVRYRPLPPAPQHEIS